jgi:hypothetical protein
MRVRVIVLTFGAASALLTGVGAVAHHSFTEFDRETEIVATGTVVRWEFNNPHSWLRMNVANADGSQTLWSFELPLKRQQVFQETLGLLGPRHADHPRSNHKRSSSR